MIIINRIEEKVKLLFKLSIGWDIPLYFERSCNMDAELLKQQMQNDFSNKISQIRRDAYLQGWKDAKSKKVAKKTRFNGSINSDFVG